jgi:ABC-type glycerol-3-phosphate transport system substrate-binding protein
MFKRSFLTTFTLVFVILAMALSLSLFSVAAQDEEPEPTPIVAELGTGDLHISFWNGLTGSDGLVMNDMLAQFVQDHPEVSVTSEIIPWDTLYAKLQAAFVAGNPPDLMLMHASEVPQFANFGVLMDVGGWYTSGGGWIPDDDMGSITRTGMDYEGVTYGIPLDNHGRGLWINVEMFEAAGLDPDPSNAPTTYEGWVELLQQLTLDANGNNAASPDFDADNVVQWGYAVGEWPRVNFLSVLAQHGGSLVSEDGTTVTVNSPAGIEALQQTVDLVYEYNVSPPPAGFDTWNAFAAGQVAVLPTGTWFLTYATVQTDIESRAWPQVQWGPEPATWFGIHTYMLPEGYLSDEKLEAIETLLRWKLENQDQWATSGQVPALISVQETLDLENFESNVVLGRGFTEYGILDYTHVATQEMYSALDPELDAALNGLKSVEDALNDAAQRMQQVLDRAG